MAYVTGANWIFRQAADGGMDELLQRYSDNLSDMIARAVGVNGATKAQDTQLLSFVHLGRWLFYVNSNSSTQARIIPPSPTLGEQVTLPDVSAVGGAFVDLDSEVDWITPGMYYTVSGVSFAQETDRI